jgi:NADH dehydrogenase
MQATHPNSSPARHRVVVVGGGFAGLQAVRKLARAPVDVTLIDRRNFHLFQPLAYQVATGALSPAEIASPLRGVLRRQTNARVLLAEVSGFDLAHRRVLTTDLATGEAEALAYDTLIVAGGSAYSYFGHDEWEQLAPAPKGLEETLEIRRRLLCAFEAAETEQVAAGRERWLTFVATLGLGALALVVAPLLGLLWRIALTVSTHGRPIDAVVHTRQSHLLGPGGPDDSFAASLSMKTNTQQKHQQVHQ